jgi:hypothetical protein
VLKLGLENSLDFPAFSQVVLVVQGPQSAAWIVPLLSRLIAGVAGIPLGLLMPLVL